MLAVCRSGGRIGSVVALLAVACVLNGQVVPPQNPRLENCKTPAVAEPWRDRQQTPECRSLEMIHAMTLEEKIGHVMERPKADRFAIPALNPADGPNGFARGPFPGPRDPPRSESRRFPMRLPWPQRGIAGAPLLSARHLLRSGGGKGVQKLSDPR
jgi:hypothetical protein